MGPKNIVLTRKDFSFFSSQTLSNLHGSDTFSDITLVSADGQLISAHKIVLTSSSSVMGKLVLPKEQVLVMDASYDELKLILKFIYTGKCEVEQKNLANFLATAKKLQIKGLITDGEDDTIKEEKNTVQIKPETPFQARLSGKSMKENQIVIVSQIPDDKNNTKSISEMENDEKEDVDALVLKPKQDLVHTNEEPNSNEIAYLEECCTLCSFFIPEAMSLKSHMQEKHNFMSCKMCHRAFSGYSDLKEHNLKDHNNSNHSTDQSAEFYYKCLTARTIANSTDNVFCNSCDFVTTDQKYLKRHARVRHNIVVRKMKTVGRIENFSCTVCSFSSNTYGHLKGHYKQHTEAQQKEFRPYSCTLCDYASETIRLLRDHSITHKETEHKIVYKYFCHYCLERCVRKDKRRKDGVQYKTTSKLEKHIAVQNELLDCVDCDENSMNFKEYCSHIQTEHPSKLTYICDQCDFKTSISWTLSRHRSNLHQGTGYQCIIEGCDYSCKVAYTRDDTKRSCDIEGCRYSSFRKLDIRAHKDNVHLKIKHICENCGFCASSKSNLIGHMKSLHKDQYPENCNLCGKCFKSCSALMTHQENKHF